MKDRGILFLGITVLALSSALVKWLIENGGSLGVDEPAAISFCNVLFVGNLLGGLVVSVLFRPTSIWKDLRRTTPRAQGLLIVNIALAVAIPMLLFTALQGTTVTNVVLIGRFESVAYALLSFLFASALLTRIQMAGYAVILLGVSALVWIQGMGKLMEGDYLVAIASVLQAVAALLVRRLLNHVELGTFVFVRNFFSALAFFVVAIVLYGAEHFADAFRGDLWVVMTVYAVIVVVLGQLAWYHGLTRVPPGTVANLSMLSPFLGILFAYLLLGEVPATAQWIGGGIILLGLLIIRAGARKPLEAPAPAENSLAGV